MTTSRLNDIQTLNMQVLQIIREGLLADREATCHAFQLTMEQAERIGSMTHAELTALATSTRGISLFIPRSNMVELLSAPPGLVALLGSVRPTRQRGNARNPGRRREDYAWPAREAS